jgi:gliding motility-associated-like protein
VNLPRNWNEVSVSQWLELNTIDEEYHNSVFLQTIEALSILSDTDPEELEDLDPEELINLARKVSFIQREPSNKPKELVKGLKLNPLDRLTLGEFIDLEHYAVQFVQNFDILLSILYKRWKTDEWGNLIFEPYSYSIMPGGQISTTGTFSNMGRGVYTITTTDVNECQTTNVITIKGTPCCDELFIPNAFTPNDDTKNDEFTFLNALDTDIELLSFIVMNRYGNSVFQAQHFYDRWDGKYKGSVCDVGTYYYFLKFKCLTSGEVIIRKGDITLIR